MNNEYSRIHCARIAKEKKEIVAGRMTETKKLKPETRGEYCSGSLCAYCHVLDYIIVLGRARLLES